ncbi:ankyrin repeat domain-containing protein 40 [Lingula anatina]|uniref:Ankyrin repeat domain-containing protein 40 n=1 Tax=Lingula anatina TaxID=7574 RepID=A0A1S3H6V7_LINAN|nr:ankyrin repeat domain-containing protein 40 [Lingula anatina]XP_013381856.1 ankyrin repeat domain-containing protein 40 [Lingula anatina]|eukprot:XP_013381855.1 ankyrin repeat domain-containing protein 40 [Lingula anatina]
MDGHDERGALAEQLRESAAIGNMESLQKLVNQGVDVNDQNNMNGWTALHWAATRGHATIVSFLLNHGADKEIKTNKGETAAQLSENPNVVKMLGGEPSQVSIKNELPITPNYIANPVFPYATPPEQRPPSRQSHNQQHQPSSTRDLPVTNGPVDNELVLKVRVAYTDEKDFIEVELEESNLTYESLMELMCKELKVQRELVHKIRKMPDTIVRKDKDVKRLKNFQELELVLTNKAISASSRTYKMPRHEQILY